MTNAVANAIAITLDREARSSYERRIRLEDQLAGEDAGQTRAEFQGALERIAAAAPGAVKVH